MRRSKRMDTSTSTNNSLSTIKQTLRDKIPNVYFEPPLVSTTTDSYLNEARERLSGKQHIHSLEPFERSVDRLVLSVNKRYGQQQQQQQLISSSNSISLNYVSQYYAQEDEPSFDCSIEINDEHRKNYYNLNTNRTHTKIMKNLNKSLIDNNYQIDKNRAKQLEQNVRRYLRLLERQSLERELNHDLIRCFTSSYLSDLRREEIRHSQTCNHTRSYTYEDIQDIYTPSVLDAYKTKNALNREKHQRLQALSTNEQLSPISSTVFSPLMISSFNENIDAQPTRFESERISFSSVRINIRIKKIIHMFCVALYLFFE